MNNFEEKTRLIKSLSGYQTTLSFMLTKNGTHTIELCGWNYDQEALAIRLLEIYDLKDAHVKKIDLIFSNDMYPHLLDILKKSDDYKYLGSYSTVIELIEQLKEVK